jgi:hypothetical protein
MVSTGNLADAAAEDDSGSPPAQGFDDASPLGSTSEHSTAEGDPAAAARSRRAAARARPAVRFPDQGSR